jgi:hypothetical protein
VPGVAEPLYGTMAVEVEASPGIEVAPVVEGEATVAIVVGVAGAVPAMGCRGSPSHSREATTHAGHVLVRVMCS